MQVFCGVGKWWGFYFWLKFLIGFLKSRRIWKTKKQYLGKLLDVTHEHPPPTKNPYMLKICLKIHFYTPITINYI
jgi:hypothetical protein